MANRWAVANGDWSSTSTWNGGTLPTTADDVFSNNFTVTIDQNVTVLSVRNESATGINAGGGFNLNAGVTLTADVYAGNVANGGTCITINYASPGSSTIVGNVSGATQGTGSTIYAVQVSNSGTLTVNGNVTAGSSSSGNSRHGLRQSSTGVVNINGNVIGTQLTTGGNTSAVSMTGGTVNVVGNVVAGKAIYSPGISSTGGSLNITGDVSTDPTMTQNNGAVELQNTNFTANGTFRYQGTSGSRCVVCFGSGSCQLSGSFVHTGTGNGGFFSLQGTVSGVINFGFNNGTVGSSSGTTASHDSSGSLVINGSLQRTGPGTVFATSGSGSQQVTLNGNIFATGGQGAIVQHNRTSGTFTVNGDVSAPTMGSGNQPGFYVQAANTTIINGNVTGGTQNGVQNQGYLTIANGSTLTVNGSVIAGSGNQAEGAGIRAVSTANIRRAVGNAYGLGSVGIISTPAVVGNQGSTISIQEFEYGLRGQSPVSLDCRIQLTSNSVVIFRDTSGNPVTLVNPASVVTPPAVTDVRSGVSYNAGNLTGTCAVPAANSVAAGVAVGNTVGTAVLTQANVWDYALSSASSVAGSVGEKLKKTAIPADIIALS